MLIYHSAARPSGPVPPLGTYTSVEITPSPTKLEDATMVGGLLAWTYQQAVHDTETCSGISTFPINWVLYNAIMVPLTRYIPIRELNGREVEQNHPEIQEKS